MTRRIQPDNPFSLLTEIEAQIHCLQEISKFYCSDAGIILLNQLSVEGRFLFVGGGTEFYLSQLAAKLCRSQGVDAAAVEADDLSLWPADLLKHYTHIFLFAADPTQIDPRCQNPEQVIFITHQPEKFLMSQAGMILPTFAGDELWPGSQSFLAGSIVAWLLNHHLSHQHDCNEADQLKRLRLRIQLLIEGKAALKEQWQRCLAGSDPILLSGLGVQGIVAAQSALTFTAWTKVHANAVPWQFPLDPGQPGRKLIEFLDLAASRSTGSVYLVDGYPLLASDPPRPAAALPDGLGCFLNWVSIQLLASKFIV